MGVMLGGVLIGCDGGDVGFGCVVEVFDVVVVG